MELAKNFIEIDNEFSRSLLFYTRGHSWEFARDDSWDKMELFAETIGGREDIWYATNIEIFDYITAYRSLRFNVDMEFVENPTSTDIYFLWHGKNYCVKSGQRISLE